MAAYHLFSPEIYTQRRTALMNSIDSGIILIMGNNEMPMNYKDNIYHFRQDSSFLYYFGINQPSMAATMNVDTGEVILYGYDYTIDDIIWVGPSKSLEDKGHMVGVKKTKPISQLASDLASVGGSVRYLPPYRHDRVIFLSEVLGSSIQEIQNGADAQLRGAVVAQRSIKSAEEVEQLSQAVDITREMHLAAMRSTRPGKYEYEVVADITRQYKRNNTELAYPIIFSVNGQTLHNHYHGNLMKTGQLALNDSGASNSMMYAGDITRTIPVSGQFTTKQKEIYNIVLEMETSVIDNMKVGDLYRDHHIASNRLMLSKFKDLGLVRGDVDEMSAAGVGGLFMPHGLGHMIGLDVHDMEDFGEQHVGYRPGLERSSQLGLKSLRLGKELEDGFVITVEPGIYFIPELIAKWKAEGTHAEFINYQKLEDYLDFGGIRIEDDILITSNGSKVLGKPIPKTVEEVEDAFRE